VHELAAGVGQAPAHYRATEQQTPITWRRRHDVTGGALCGAHPHPVAPTRRPSRTAHRTQAELFAAATTVATNATAEDRIGRGEQRTGREGGRAVHHQSNTVIGKVTPPRVTRGRLCRVRQALTAVRAGHTTIQRLLDQYTAQGNQVMSAALKTVDAGQHGALIGAAADVSRLAARYTAESDTALPHPRARRSPGHHQPGRCWRFPHTHRAAPQRRSPHRT